MNIHEGKGYKIQSFDNNSNFNQCTYKVFYPYRLCKKLYEKVSCLSHLLHSFAKHYLCLFILESVLIQ